MKSYKRRNMLTIRWTLGLMLSTSCQSTRTYYPDSKPTSLCSFFSSCTAFILEATNSNFIIFGLTRQEHKICRTQDEHAHNYMTDTKHSLPSIVDNIKPKVHRIVNIFLRLYDVSPNI
jgi:predicted HTH transcriptional regulator